MQSWGGFFFIINLIKQTNMTIEEYKQLMKRDILKIGLDVDEATEVVEDDDYKVTIDYENLTTTFEVK